MDQLIRVASCHGQTRGHVIFVHGLGGHPYDTWRSASDEKSFWPLWLARDIKGLNVWTLRYATPATNWLGTAMPLQDRAVNVLEILLGVPELRNAPIAFVCHSLGGLVVKQMLREANDQKAKRSEAKVLLERVKAVVFMATPHAGSVHASLLDRLRLVAWPSTAAHDLVKNDPNLRNLNVWYRNWTHHVKSRIFYETQGTTVGKIVDPGSADAGLPNVVPVPIGADHVTISKPASPDDLVYVSTRDFLMQEVVRTPEIDAGSAEPEIRSLPLVDEPKTTNWVPIALRLSILAIVFFVVFKGITAILWPPKQVDSNELIDGLMESSFRVTIQGDRIIAEKDNGKIVVSDRGSCVGRHPLLVDSKEHRIYFTVLNLFDRPVSVLEHHVFSLIDRQEVVGYGYKPSTLTAIQSGESRRFAVNTTWDIEGRIQDHLDKFDSEEFGITQAVLIKTSEGDLPLMPVRGVTQAERCSEI